MYASGKARVQSIILEKKREMQWAILSGIEGNLAAYEAVLQHIQRQAFPVTDIYILGDMIGLKGDDEKMIERLRSPRSGELEPQVCIGWWEEQIFSLHYADELTPTTSPEILCDRLIRADANTLFCGRSGLTFECKVTPSRLRSTVTTLEGSQPPQDQGKTPRRVVGVGSVGRKPGEASYVLYTPGTDVVSFQWIDTKVLSY